MNPFTTFSRAMSQVMDVAMFALELSGVVLICFTLSRWAVCMIVTTPSPINPEGSPLPFFKAILQSTSCVRQFVNTYCSRIIILTTTAKGTA